jgi:N-acetyl-alpha-D-muramate 1-phosphate uridylyltransferase
MPADDLKFLNKPSGCIPDHAIVLSAGKGLRMRPITNSTPKPMIQVGGRTLLDRTLDRLEDSKVKKVVVNLHHLGAQIERHLGSRKSPDIAFSHEDELLETGGGVLKALPQLGKTPFFVVNADAMLLNGSEIALDRMKTAWDDGAMDGLLLLQSTVEAYGYRGRGDFWVDPSGVITRRPEREVSPYLFTGTQILHPRLFKGSPKGAFSLNVLYDKAIEEKRLFGIVHDGEWFHIGTPDGLAEAETYVQTRYPGIRHR